MKYIKIPCRVSSLIFYRLTVRRTADLSGRCPLSDLVASQSEIPRSPAIHEAMVQAQHLAFAPVSFMTAYCMKRLGVLDRLYSAMGEGLNDQELAVGSELTPYAAGLLLESGLAIGAVLRIEDRYHLSKLGHILRSDPMTDANFEFMYQVCYQGLFHLETALRTGKPSGLATISQAATVYEGLHQLPDPIKKAWLNFDHFYSDSAFGEALPYVFANDISRLMDIGGNTGRFAGACLNYNTKVQVTVCDLPQQVAMASDSLAAQVAEGRLNFYACDLLQEDTTLPQGYQVIWMSQFLVCFDQATILRIFRLAHAALEPGGRLMVLDTFWDRQKDPVSAFCLIQTSPYFTAIANGNSKIYRSDAIQAWAEAAGFSLLRVIDELGVSHSLMIFTKAQFLKA